MKQAFPPSSRELADCLSEAPFLRRGLGRQRALRVEEPQLSTQLGSLPRTQGSSQANVPWPSQGCPQIPAPIRALVIPSAKWVRSSPPHPAHQS